MDLSVEEFWQNYEREIGEKIISRTMAQCFVSEKDRGDWGLLVLSSSALRFRKTPGDNWFSSLFKASTTRIQDTKIEDTTIPLTAIREITDPPKKLLDILFGSPFRQINVRFSEPDGERTLRFALDPKSDLLTQLKNCT